MNHRRSTDQAPLDEPTVPAMMPRRAAWWSLRARLQCGGHLGLTCDAESLGEAVAKLQALANWRGLVVRTITSARQVG